MRALVLAVALLAPACMGAELALSVGGTIDQHGHVSVDILPRVGVGVSGDGKSVLAFAGGAADINLGHEKLFAIGPSFSGFSQDGPGDLGFAAGFAGMLGWLDGRIGAKLMLYGALYRQLDSATDDLGGCDPDSFEIGPCKTRRYGNAGGQLSLGMFFTGDDRKPTLLRFQLGLGAMVSGTLAQE